MIHTDLFKTLSIALATVVLRAGAQSAVTAEPDQVHFSKYEDSAVIHIMKGTEPVRSKAIKSVRAMIGTSDYSHQFVITKSKSGPATITLSPKEGAAQAGTFALVISTADGDALVAIDMPLDKIPGTLEDRAKKEGVTVDELKAKMGLSQEGKRETIAVLLPQWQYVGSTFSLRMPPTPGREYTWKIDGKVVEQGKDLNVLKYVLDKAGNRYVEMEVRDGDTVVAQWSGVLPVMDYPDMRWQVRKGQPFELRGAKGYKSHEWKIDGHGAGKGDALKHKFKDAGEHVIECTSRDPVIGEPGEYRSQTWQTSVK